MAKKKHTVAKTIFSVIGIALVLVIALGVWTIFGKPSVKANYNASDFDAATTQLPVLSQVYTVVSNNNSMADYEPAEPKPMTCTFTPQQLDSVIGNIGPAVVQALTGSELQSNQPAQFALSGEVMFDGAFTAVNVKDIDFNKVIKLTQSNISNDVLTVKVLLGDCTGLSGEEVLDKFISNVVITVCLKTVDKKAVIADLGINNLKSSAIPTSILQLIPDYPEGKDLVDYINENCGSTVTDVFEKLLMAKDITSIEIKDGKIVFNGEFYTRLVKKGTAQ